MSDKLQGIVDQIKELTLLEASQLVKLMEETFGVSAAAAAVPSLSSSRRVKLRIRSQTLDALVRV